MVATTENAPVIAGRKRIFNEISVEIYQGADALTFEQAKEILGWTLEPEATDADGKAVKLKPSDDWGKDFFFRDPESKRKVRLLNNLKNRPFRMPLALRYGNEFLRGKFVLNGETIVRDWTGGIPQGQHRLVGFVMAEATRRANPAKWGKKPLRFEVVIVTGVDPKHANTYDLGQKRTLGDVFYRTHEFGGKTVSKAEEKKLANIYAGTVRLVWLRAGGKTVSDAPHFPHTEAVDFGDRHDKLADAVRFMYGLEGGTGAEGKKITSRLTIAYAAAMYYLMATSNTTAEQAAKGEWDFSNEENAKLFWTLFAEGVGDGMTKGNPIVVLREKLSKDKGATKRDDIVTFCVKAWRDWMADAWDDKYNANKLKATKEEPEPRIGGVDVSREVIAEEAEGVEIEWAEGDWAWIATHPVDGGRPLKVKITKLTKKEAKATVDDADKDYPGQKLSLLREHLLADRPEEADDALTGKDVGEEDEADAGE